MTDETPSEPEKPWDLLDQALFALTSTMNAYFLYLGGQSTHLHGYWHKVISKNDVNAWVLIILASLFWGFVITGAMRKWAVLYLLLIFWLVMSG